MTQELLTKSEFARRAGVNPSTVTRLCETLLKGAVVGKQLDAAHPDAVAYLVERARPPTSDTGLDPLYPQAVDLCHKEGRFNVGMLRKALGIGYGRAVKIVDTMRASGFEPNPDAPAWGEQAPTPKAKLLGQAAAKETQKAEAWAAAADENPEEVFEIPEHFAAFADMTLRELIERFGTDRRFIDWLSATQKIEAINEKRLKNAETEGRLISRDLVKTAVLDRIDGVFVRMLTDGAKTIAARAHSMAQADAPVADVRAMVEDQLGSFIRPAKVKMREALREDGRN